MSAPWLSPDTGPDVARAQGRFIALGVAAAIGGGGIAFVITGGVFGVMWGIVAFIVTAILTGLTFIALATSQADAAQSAQEKLNENA